MNARLPRFALTALGLCLAAAVPAAAQKAPELGYVFPPALLPGETHEVRLGGYDFTGDMQFFVHDDGVKLDVRSGPGRFFVPEPPYWFGEKGRSNALPIPREIPATLTIAKDHPPGLVRWQVANANGSSKTAVCYVSDTPEIVESRYRNDAQSLESLPIGVSGRLSRIAEVDRYSFRVERDGPVSVELFARTLGADFNGVLEVRGEDGRLLADAADTEGVDTALTFAAKANRRYTLSLHDVDFRGHRAFVYRLAITPGPRVVATLPAVGRRGTTADVRFIGVGLATGRAELETITRKVTFPKHGDVLRYRMETPFGRAPAFEIPLARHEERVRPDGTGETPLRVNVPAAVTGTMTARPAEFVWAASKDDVFRIDARSRAFGGRLDLSLEIVDADGKTRAANDDFAGSVDPSLVFKAPADGDYVCRVIDLSGHSEHIDSVYRLSMTRPESGYTLTVPQQVNLGVGAKANLKLTVARTGGHTAAIPIRIEGLPAGVTVPAPDTLVVPEGKSSLAIPLQSDAAGAAVAAAVRIIGHVPGESAVVARAPAAGNLCPPDTVANTVDRVLLTTTLAPKFSVELVDKNRQRAVHRGTTYPAPFLVKRHDGFNGDIALQMLAKQGRHRQGIDGPILPVPAGATEVLYPCYMPEWLETDRTTRMVVLGVGRQQDPQGNVREVTKQADARITMILEGALLRVAHELDELTIDAGDSFEIPVVVSRSAKLPIPVELQVIAPAELTEFVRAEPVELSPTETRAQVRVVTTGNAAAAGRWPLTIKATALREGRWLVVSRTELSVQINAAAKSASAD